MLSLISCDFILFFFQRFLKTSFYINKIIFKSSKKINFDSTKYNDVKIKNLNNISRLYLKDSLQQLQNTEADYILID